MAKFRAKASEQKHVPLIYLGKTRLLIYLLPFGLYVGSWILLEVCYATLRNPPPLRLPSEMLRMRYYPCTSFVLHRSLLQIPLSEQQRICIDYEEGRSVSMVCETNPSIDENNVKSILRNYRLCWREKLRSPRIGFTPLGTLILSSFSDYSSQFMQIHRWVNKLFPYTT